MPSELISHSNRPSQLAPRRGLAVWLEVYRDQYSLYQTRIIEPAQNASFSYRPAVTHKNRMQVGPRVLGRCTQYAGEERSRSLTEIVESMY